MITLPISKRRCGICGLADHAEEDCPIAVAGEAAVKDGRCCTCKKWARGEESVMGDCSCEKMIYDPLGLSGVRDALVYMDHSGAGARIMTGDWFGCVHWRERS